MNLAEQYIQSVTEGKESCCKWVSKAVERHVNDLKEDKYVFNQAQGEKAIGFAKLLRHTEGKWAGEQFNLQPWQAFILYCLFGWQTKKGGRRFLKAYIEVARKNGKSEFAAVIQIIGFLLDNEDGAQIYSAATKMEQAKIVFQKTRSMLRRLSAESDFVNDNVEVRRHDILRDDNDSIIRAVGADAHTLDGLSPHVAIVDEYHAHKNSDVLDVLESGMGARNQPLLFIITTAGFNVQGPCYQLRQAMQDVLEGRVESDREFAIIYTLDEEDDWKDEKNWVKCNPNIGESPSWEFIRSQFNQAINQGGQKEVSFKTKNLNIWVRSSDTYIQDELWAECDYNSRIIDGEKVHIGVDIAASGDIAAVAYLFPPSDVSERYRVKVDYYLPEMSVEDRRKTGEAPYKKWVEDGWITTTTGNATDQSFIEADIVSASKQYDVQTIDVDPWNARYFMNNLQEKGLEPFDFWQSHKKYHEPTVKLQTLVKDGQIDHFGDPVLRWMISNVELNTNRDGHVKPDKSNRKNKIDGVSALLMALGGHLYTKIEGDDPYKDRGLLVI